MATFINQMAYFIMYLIAGLFPIVSAASLVICFIKKNLKFALIALWISVIAVAFNYKLAGNHLLGAFFNIPQATLYSLNLILFTIATIYVLYHIKQMLQKKYAIIILDCFAIGFFIGIIVILSNLWINASFVNSRFSDTPIIKLNTLNSKLKCEHGSIFIKINTEGKVQYLCPKGYGFIAAIHTLNYIPSFLANRFKPELIHRLTAKNPEWEHIH